MIESDVLEDHQLAPVVPWHATRPARAAALIAYVAVFAWAVRSWGVPFERPILLAWLMGGAIVATYGRPSGGAIAVLRDWLPYGVALTVYDFTRGMADGVGLPVHFRLPIVADEILGLGTIPTVRLQHWLGGLEGAIAWWEIPMALTYTSHFIVPFVIPAVLWVRHRERFRAWRAQFFTVVGMGLVTFVILPSAPPWMASRDGYLPELQRAPARGWSKLGIHSAERVFDLGTRVVNPVAAVPSLHAAFAGLAAAFFWSRTPRLARPLLALYPLFMAFTLVVAAEHYLFDVLLGWAYVALAIVIWNRYEARRISFRPDQADGHDRHDHD